MDATAIKVRFIGHEGRRGKDGAGLTCGNIYSAYPNGDYYSILSDNDGDERYRSGSEFEVVAVDEQPPAKTQVGGNHYVKMGIQPWEYALANNMGHIEATVLKYISRWKDKNGIEDLKKARHALDYLIAYQEKQDGK